MNILAYSLITIPDFATGSKLHNLQGLDHKGTAKALFHLQAQQTGNECLPSYLQQVVAISLVLMDETEKLQTTSLKDVPEIELLNQFFDIVEQYKPMLITWDGEYFNSEVIGYRSIKQAIPMSPHYENKDNHFNLNQAMVSSSAVTPLEDIATLLGLPAQKNRNSREMCESYLADDTDGLYAYSEGNALNSYQIYLRYQLSHGEIDKACYERLAVGLEA